MLDLLNAVSTNPVLERILPLLPGRTYLVGGCVRDLILGTASSDFDLVTSEPSLDLAQRIAEHLGGTAFLLDRRRQVARVALNKGELTVDVSPPKGKDIAADLAERDITINAMAIQPFDGTLIDPLGGVKDLQGKRIRLIAERNLKDDPLRGLRCLRFSVQLGFSLDMPTMETIRRNARGLERIAPERIKTEFLKALKCPASAPFIKLVIDAGLAPVLFPGVRDEDLPHHGFKYCSRVEHLLLDAPADLPGIRGFCADELEHGLSRAGALRLAAFFAGMAGALRHEYHDGLVSSWCRRLALSSPAARVIERSILGMLRVGHLKGKTALRGSDRHRVLSAYRGCIPEMLLLVFASDHRVPRELAGGASDRALAASLWGYYLTTFQDHAAHPLVTGDEIMNILSMDPGPGVGKLLLRVEEARADGTITSREHALEYLRTLKREG